MEIKINNFKGIREIGTTSYPYIIAEAGINHNGDIEIAKRLIYEAWRSGADAIKFQKRTIEEMFIKEHLDKPYNKDYSFGKTYGEHKKALEFSDTQYFEIYNYAKDLGIDFLCSGFDSSSFNFIEYELNVPFHKVASPFITDYPLLKQVATYGKPILLSTGMHSMKEIKESVNFIKKYNDKIIVLQATTLYPCPNKLVNLRVLETFRKDLETLVGYSSHDNGVILPAVAVAFGACVIEKHFTLDRAMIGPDHVASVEPRGLELVCKYTKSAFDGLGNGIKEIQQSEILQREKYGVSIVTTNALKASHVITEKDITVKCPGGGVSPVMFNDIIGKRLKRNLAEDSIIFNDDVEWNPN